MDVVSWEHYLSYVALVASFKQKGTSSLLIDIILQVEKSVFADDKVHTIFIHEFGWIRKLDDEMDSSMRM